MKTFERMTDIGKLFGVSPQTIGKWLFAIGLRTSGNLPTKRAFQEGYVARTSLGQGHSYFKWHVQKTIAALEKAGHKRLKSEELVVHKLHGPFSLKASNVKDGCRIHNADGTHSVVVIGQTNAEKLVALMNANRERLEGE